jgi:hypothetical protein
MTKDKVDVFEHADKNRKKKTKEAQTEDARPLGHQ